MTHAQTRNGRQGNCACSRKRTRAGAKTSRSASGSHALASGRKREGGGSWREANFNCVTVEFGLKTEFSMNQSLRFLDLILSVCLLSNFESDFGRGPHSTHAPVQFGQPRVRNVFGGGSGDGRGKGGASLSGHAHARPASSGKRRKNVPRATGSG